MYLSASPAQHASLPQRQTVVREERMSAALQKSKSKAPVTFWDLAIYFSQEGWKWLSLTQKDFYEDIMLENYQNGLCQILLLEAKCDHFIGEGESTLDDGTSMKIPGPG